MLYFASHFHHGLMEISSLLLKQYLEGSVGQTHVNLHQMERDQQVKGGDSPLCCALRSFGLPAVAAGGRGVGTG